MRLLYALVIPGLGSSRRVIHSAKNSYDVCRRLSDGESSSDVFFAVMQPKVSYRDEHASHICSSNDRAHSTMVVVKCEKPNPEGENLINEIDRAKALSSEPWAVDVIESFTIPAATDSSHRCYSMRALGRSLREMRKKSKTNFDDSTLASIGLQMTLIMKSLHNDHGLYHTDVHAANWLLRITDPTKISLIDYGYMRPLSTPQEAIKELQEMIVTLRWYIDMKTEWYVPKKILRLFGEIDVKQLSRHSSPILGPIIEYIFSLTPDTYDPTTTYDIVAKMFKSQNTCIVWKKTEHIELLSWNSSPELVKQFPPARCHFEVMLPPSHPRFVAAALESVNSTVVVASADTTNSKSSNSLSLLANSTTIVTSFLVYLIFVLHI